MHVGLRDEPDYAIINAFVLVVVDLPSLPNKNMSLMAMSNVMENYWTHARDTWALSMESSYKLDKRIPLFIVLDEAHQFIPVEVHGGPEASLREQFRTVAAEGRKYGLFLILVSQRPDKLDPLVLSECGNKALMKFNWRAVATEAFHTLGLQAVEPTILERLPQLGISRALLVGDWAPDMSMMLYSAARRTREGGLDLHFKERPKQS